jgi:hypothetical protein
MFLEAADLHRVSQIGSPVVTTTLDMACEHEVTCPYSNELACPLKSRPLRCLLPAK